MTNRTLTLAFAALASLATAPALASGNYETRTTEVSYGDLDLSTADGLKRLDQRIDRAAREVCGLNAATTGTRIPSSESHACYRETRSKLDTRVAALVAAHSRG